MDMPSGGLTSRASGGAAHALVTVQLPSDHPDPVAQMRMAFGADDPEQIFLFMSPSGDLGALGAACSTHFPQSRIVGCTTAGEIGPGGYLDDHLVAIALPRRHFRTRNVLIQNLDALEPQALIDELVQERIGLTRENPDRPNGFAFLLVDGMSLREDMLAGTIAPALGTFPVFGGSAGDGMRFEETRVLLDGKLYTNAAVLTFAVTDCLTRVFSLDHLMPTGTRMVVTDADPDRRVVKEINAEPAAQEYARIIGKTAGDLDEFTFAAHPVVVRLGDTHHVRSIQRVGEDGQLHFFSAIDEGMVLTVANAQDLSAHLDAELTRLSETRRPADILGCDCLLRKIEAEQSQIKQAVSDVLQRNRVVGFSTYGEQIGPMHVNHTMTGVAFYLPDGTL